ncbi:N-acetylglucosamine kinase [Paramaledivibacter caminithermalis]|jgi:N-acetylglucosamine kinase-like BadF-type ATPase|uniref:BadF-type ATPase n=1 Tax=Paramaledivibacter caminithermalis (strain DSM 15212 / CIP 107654 / DViRD3) TaxID=1121301 RepID=A0A1M6PJ70_PARC5|nr:BadF/BadG/BcrA/BcrD ATPase family protein [Paramaledivibacter caminithermalis]SHK07991.1 BadF-type ATPase [Paramaledivibacter caminithermalis DSM 15212]
MIYLGVDGGGTKTAFMLINDEGKILGCITKGTCHYKQVGMDGFSKTLEQGINEICNKIQIDIKDIDFSFLGIPGYGEIIEDAKNMENKIEDIFKSDYFKCGNDVEAAWAGSLACKPGINIVAGTGAIGVGVDKYGKVARSSGWGHFCGDEGSAYWLGKKAIEIFGKESDGRLEKTPLYEIVRQELAIDRDFDLISLVLNKYGMNRGKIAELAKLIFMAAKAGDKYAIKAFEEAAYELSLIVFSIIKQLDFDDNDELLISYSGGVFRSGEFILNPFKKYILETQKNIKIVTPKLLPVTGAALYALKIKGSEFNEKIVDILMKEESKLL